MPSRSTKPCIWGSKPISRDHEDLHFGQGCPIGPHRKMLEKLRLGFFLAQRCSDKAYQWGIGVSYSFTSSSRANWGVGSFREVITWKSKDMFLSTTTVHHKSVHHQKCYYTVKSFMPESRAFCTRNSLHSFYTRSQMPFIPAKLPFLTFWSLFSCSSPFLFLFCSLLLCSLSFTVRFLLWFWNSVNRMLTKLPLINDQIWT